MSQAFLQGEKKIPFSLSRDGAIRADDVPPGTLTLSLQLESANVDPMNVEKPPFGSLKKQIVVPSADDETAPVDLGELAIEQAR